MKEMFCFQCQQTAHNVACDDKVGVCGKKSDTANYQDELTGALIGLARASKSGNPTDKTDVLILKGLFTTITNVNFNDVTIKKMKTEVEQEKGRVNAEKFEDCGACRYLRICGGGCRARSLFASGSLESPDSYCAMTLEFYDRLGAAMKAAIENKKGGA